MFDQTIQSVIWVQTLDLDNTVWGGMIGDDGIENIQIGDLGQGKAFTELQYWAKELKQRGIILAICSKNDENIAKSPFKNHPDMISPRSLLKSLEKFLTGTQRRVCP